MTPNGVIFLFFSPIYDAEIGIIDRMPVSATHMKPAGTCLAQAISHVDITAESTKVNFDFLSIVLYCFLSVSNLLSSSLHWSVCLPC